MSDNPFSDPFNGGQFGPEALEKPEEAGAVKCPSCKSTNFRAWTNQYGVMRKCNECKNQWSGCTVAVGRIDYSEVVPPQGVDAPVDLPVVQYTGSAFRDPSKIVDGE